MSNVADLAELLQTMQDLKRLKRTLDHTSAEDIDKDDIQCIKTNLRRIEQQTDAFNKSKHRRAPMRPSSTYSNKRATRNTSPRYENKARMSQQLHEIKSSICGQYQMQFNEEYNELAHDPEQQEGFVGWYYTRLKKGIVGF
jgi:hypothetical protein